MPRVFRIFLDFDGVLITKFSSLSEKHVGLAFGPVCIENLKIIIESLKREYQSVIVVVISNWRYDLEREQIRNLLLCEYTLETFVSDIHFTEKRRNKIKEIKGYIEDNKVLDNTYIIIDDEDLGPELSESQIRTRSEDGIRGVSSVWEVKDGEGWRE